MQERYGTAKRACHFYEHQVVDSLNLEMRRFIARMEMVFISTADANGECDCSFRAGPPGFVRVLSDWRLVYPEYRGNGVLASLGNIVENAHVGLLFVDFFSSTVGLHVNGCAKVVEHAELLNDPRMSGGEFDDPTAPRGRQPERWVMVEVEEAYIHCSKHIPRLVKTDKEIAWGTDDESRKKGDYFGTVAIAKTCRKSPRPAEVDAEVRHGRAAR